MKFYDSPLFSCLLLGEQSNFNAVLGEEKATIEQAQFGGIDLIRVNISPLAEFVPEYNSILFPYIFANREHYWRVMDSEEVGKALLQSQKMLDNNLYGLCFYDNGTRNFFFSKNEVHTPADLKGLAVRVQESALMLGMVRAMGGNPTAMAASELYSALQTGVVDGAEQPIANYRSNAFPEVAPYLMLDGHTLGAIQIVITDMAWAKLTEEQQAAIMEAGKLTQAYNAELSAGEEAKVLELLKTEGVHIIEVEDKAPWVEACKGTIEKNTADQAELYQQIVNMQ